MVAVRTSVTSSGDFPLIRRFAAPSPQGEGVSRWCFQVLPLDGEGGLPRSGKTEGVKAPGASKSLKVTHSTTPAAWSPSPVKGEDLPITEATR